MNETAYQKALAFASNPVQRAQALHGHTGALICIVSADLRVVYANREFAEFFSVKPEALVGCLLSDLYGTVQVDGYMKLVRHCLEEGEEVHFERRTRAKSADEAPGWLTINLHPLRDDNGTVFGIVSTSLPIDKLRTANAELAAANQRLAFHLHNSPLAVIEFDADLRVAHWSPRASQIFGWTEVQVMGQPLSFFASANPHDRARLEAAIQTLKDGREVRNRIECKIVTRDGDQPVCEWFNSALTSPSGEVVSIMSLIEDVSSRSMAADRLRYIAEHDSLTGLPNRGTLQGLLERALTRARRTHDMLAVLFIDLDGFKAVNDRYGHEIGDKVLCEVARRLKTAVRDTDTVARLGGDEFVVLLDTKVDLETADVVSGRIMTAVKKPYSFAHGDSNLPGVAVVGTSIGIAAHPPLAPDAKVLMRAADAAMYQAKQAGKGHAVHARSDDAAGGTIAA